MINLKAILYVSASTHMLSPFEIDHLLRRARERNACEQVTGVLLYSDGNFMQYIEGDAPRLAKIYAVIRDDPWHQGMIELLREPIQKREFSEWSMAFRAVGTFKMSHPLHPDAALSERLATPATSYSSARILLSKFWNRGKGPNS
jgi:hypothetical protein